MIKIYLYAKDQCKLKYQLLINEQKIIGLKHFSNFKALLKYSNDMDDIYRNIEK